MQLLSPLLKLPIGLRWPLVGQNGMEKKRLKPGCTKEASQVEGTENKSRGKRSVLKRSVSVATADRK